MTLLPANESKDIMEKSEELWIKMTDLIGQ